MTVETLVKAIANEVRSDPPKTGHYVATETILAKLGIGDDDQEQVTRFYLAAWQLVRSGRAVGIQWSGGQLAGLRLPTSA